MTFQNVRSAPRRTRVAMTFLLVVVMLNSFYFGHGFLADYSGRSRIDFSGHQFTSIIDQLPPRFVYHHRRDYCQKMSVNKESDDGGEGENEKKKSGPISLAELSQKEQEASRRVMNRLLLPQRIGKAINTTAYVFIGVALVLNIFGYSLYIKDGGFTIDTLENRAFQMELNRSDRPKSRY